MPLPRHALSRPWSSTLRLPRSTFPVRISAADQAQLLPRCSDELYAWQRHERPATSTFILHDGPPYANGSLHIGHALNKILKDIICRFKVTEGRRVHYVPGWDCHGLPIELKALQRRQNLTGNAIRTTSSSDPMQIRSAARELAAGAVEEQSRSLKDWGIMADWNSAWKTMDQSYEMKQLEIFRSMVDQG